VFLTFGVETCYQAHLALGNNDFSSDLKCTETLNNFCVPYCVIITGFIVIDEKFNVRLCSIAGQTLASLLHTLCHTHFLTASMLHSLFAPDTYTHIHVHSHPFTYAPTHTQMC
jgi:hypothetical protein